MTSSAIETKYNGYKFRSRTEARWAVFFDEMKIKYQYEVEGFELHYHGRYLPDFFLPKCSSWIEIKPRIDFGFDQYVEKISNDFLLMVERPIELAIAIKQPVYIILGDPLDYYYVSIAPFSGLCRLGLFDKNQYLYFNKDKIGRTDAHYHTKEAQKAREARFEFGETPKPENSNGNSAKTLQIDLQANRDFRVLQAQWDKVRNKVNVILKERGKSYVSGLLNAGILAEISGNKIEIYYQSELVRKRVDRFKPLIQDTLFEVLGSTTKIEFTTGANTCEDEIHDINKVTSVMLENFRNANFAPSVIQSRNINFLKDLEISFEIYDSLTQDQFKWLAKYYMVACRRGAVPEINNLDSILDF